MVVTHRNAERSEIKKRESLAARAHPNKGALTLGGKNTFVSLEQTVMKHRGSDITEL